MADEAEFVDGDAVGWRHVASEVVGCERGGGGGGGGRIGERLLSVVILVDGVLMTGVLALCSPVQRAQPAMRVIEHVHRSDFERVGRGG